VSVKLKILTAIAAPLILLCILCAGGIAFDGGTSARVLLARTDRVRFFSTSSHWDTKQSGRPLFIDRLPVSIAWNVRGLELIVARDGNRTEWWLWISDLALLPVLAIIPAIWAVVLYLESRSWRRIARGQCSRCGYDLRMSSDRCPECGLEPNVLCHTQGLGP
jgi:hypothetical protein